MGEVKLVKEISPAGKAALKFDQDVNSLDNLEPTFETPVYNSNVVEKFHTEVKTPGEGISYKWTPSDDKDDSKFWSNVEFNKYHNNIMDSKQFRTPAHLESREKILWLFMRHRIVI